MKLTTQQVFDNALFGLRKQRVRSTDIRDLCMYRGTSTKGEVLRCGIGLSVEDDGIAREMDESSDSSISALVNSIEDVEVIFGHLNPDFLREVQGAHDENLALETECEGEVVRGLALFEMAMSNIAAKYELNYTKD